MREILILISFFLYASYFCLVFILKKVFIFTKFI